MRDEENSGRCGQMVTGYEKKRESCTGTSMRMAGKCVNELVAAVRIHVDATRGLIVSPSSRCFHTFLNGVSVAVDEKEL